MRHLEGIWGRLVGFVAMGLAGFHLYTGVFGLLPAPEQRAVHVGLGLVLVFALYPLRKSSRIERSIPWWDLLLIALALLSAGNIFFNWMQYMPVMKSPASPFEVALAVTATVMVLESGRRTIGWVFPILTTLMIVYALWGQYIPGEFGHAPISWRMILTQIYFFDSGMWGFLTGISATYIALFIIFGTILLRTGGGQTFIDLSMLIAGKFRGGPAKVAVIASGFFAMLSGSPSTNVVTTGSFTIPMMKKLGYSPEFAGGVEATASTGGLVTPPIMGAAAFIMAEFLNIAYLKVIIAAAIPALLFYVAVFMGVHFEAVKLNLKSIPREELPPWRSVITPSRILRLFLPIAALLYTLLSGYSLIVVGTSACLIALVTYILLTDLSLNKMKERLWNVPHVLETAGKAVITIVSILVCANILLCLLNYTGLGIKVANTIIALGEDYLVLSVFLTGTLVLILGCGLTVSASYILGVTAAAPLLIGWELTPLAAHLFILYYSVISHLTPPVCPAIFVASTIAKSDWVKTALVALRLAPLLYVMPFLFLFDNTFLMMGAPWAILLNTITAVTGAIMLSSGAMGQLITKSRIYESLALVGSGALLLIPGWQTDLFGAVLVSVILAKQQQRNRRRLQR